MQNNEWHSEKLKLFILKITKKNKKNKNDKNDVTINNVMLMIFLITIKYEKSPKLLESVENNTI